jgi:CO dehydrogenase nickel-insertion accessory protein CooC1
MNQIKVTVENTEGTGKSLVLELVTAALQSAGMRVIVRDAEPDTAPVFSLGKFAMDTIVHVETAAAKTAAQENKEAAAKADQEFEKVVEPTKE